MLRLVFLTVLLACGGCSFLDSSNSLNPVEGTLVSGSSFGECLGYCSASLSVAPGGRARLLETGADFIDGAYQALPERRRELDLGPEGYAALQAALDADALASAREVYGCPDCADGGAEYVGVEGGKRVTFEYGRAPAAVEDFAEAMRAVRGRFAE